MEQPTATTLPSIEALEADLCRRNFRRFVAMSWHTAQPGRPFRPNYGSDAVCDHLQAVAKGQIRNLIINIPPRMAKSTIASVLFLPWVWSWDPGRRFLNASYAEDQSLGDALKCMRVCDSEWYQARFGPASKSKVTWEFLKEKKAQNFFENDKAGYRKTLGVNSGATGKGADIRIIDDAHKAREALSDVKRNAVISWYDQEWSSRAEDFATFCDVVIGQRLHVGDLSGVLIGRDSHTLLVLPMEYDPRRISIPSPIGWKDPRTEPGQLLAPNWISAEAVAALKKPLGDYGVAGQLQQEPVPLAGGLFKREWWKFYRSEWSHPGSTAPALPASFDTIISSWDMTFKRTEDGSFVVGLGMAACAADRYVLDRRRDRLDMPETLEAVRDMAERLRTAYRSYDIKHLVEEKANGAAVVSMLEAEIPGMTPMDTDGGKESRAYAASPTVQAGNVWLPEGAPWVWEFIEELARFPLSPNDDQVDAFSQGINYLNSIPVVAAPTFIPFGIRDAPRMDD